MSNSVFRQRIGPALVAEGIINPAQLREAMAQFEGFPYFTLEQTISYLFRVPMQVIDEVSIRTVIMPQFTPMLMERLRNIAAKDRFARNMDLTLLVRDVQYRVKEFDAKGTNLRAYRYTPEGLAAVEMNRYVVTHATVHVTIKLLREQQAEGAVHITHDGSKRTLTIDESDDELKTTLYYAMRNAHKQMTAK